MINNAFRDSFKSIEFNFNVYFTAPKLPNLTSEDVGSGEFSNFDEEWFNKQEDAIDFFVEQLNIQIADTQIFVRPENKQESGNTSLSLLVHMNTGLREYRNNLDKLRVSLGFPSLLQAYLDVYTTSKSHQNTFRNKS